MIDKFALPQLAQINLATGVISVAEQVIIRKLSDMPAYYQDQSAVRELLKTDPIIYSVYMPKQPSEVTGMYTATSVIEPGQIGNEFYMTKGHFHLDESAPEVYLTLSGEGLLVMQTHSGQSQVQDMKPGTVSYIPGDWAHRTVNAGKTPLVFFAIWPVDAGHDYDSIDDMGFNRLVLVGDDGPHIVVNPHFE
jgi:glucose-6-phosphate isomerase